MRKAVLVAIVVAMAALLVGCPDPLDADRDGNVSEHDILFEVFGTAAQIWVVYNKERTEVITIDDVAVPWSDTARMSEGWTVTLQARNETNAGQVSVRLSVDGQIMASKTDTTPFGLASVTGTIGSAGSFQ